MVDDRPAIVRQLSVEIGDIVNHINYGAGLVVSSSLETCFAAQKDPTLPASERVYTVMWSSGILDEGWVASRLAQWVVSSS